ncbi:MAG: DUF1501 domain-containing protein [Pirellula sp.]|nr:DUF1501 domain-containing protein [Pirellula sp.]
MEPLNENFMNQQLTDVGCSSLKHMERRRFLGRGVGLTAGALGGWTAIAEQLAISSSAANRINESRPKNLIFLWLQGGPSQLETFDPHPGKKIGGSVKGIESSLKGTQISDLLPQTAEVMHLATLVRSMTSKEGDHERATYTMKTGWRPDPTLIHPAIGSVLCHQSEGNVEIPRHISILASQWPARGGYMGPQLDAFQVGDPNSPIANLRSPVDATRRDRRMANLQSIAEAEFRKGRLKNLDAERTQQITATQRALKMMDSNQIEAFEIDKEPASVVNLFGDSSFGRGCLAAVRLVQQGVTCVEVELNGWDTHANNHGFHQSQCKILDAALYGLITELDRREMLRDTIVVCGGEFGRTPTINVAEGRDHWPTGFSTTIFGGPFRRGFVHGETSSEEPVTGEDPLKRITDPVSIEDLHATILNSFGIDFSQELQTPVGRPLALSKGTVQKTWFQS